MTSTYEDFLHSTIQRSTSLGDMMLPLSSIDTSFLEDFDHHFESSSDRGAETAPSLTAASQHTNDIMSVAGGIRNKKVLARIASSGNKRKSMMSTTDEEKNDVTDGETNFARKKTRTRSTNAGGSPTRSSHAQTRASSPESNTGNNTNGGGGNGLRGGAADPFPLKLHRMLEDVEEEGLSSVVSWKPHGRAFGVSKARQFVELVMPRHFRQSKITSFQRQLNLYGFQRITRGIDIGCYYHPLFLRGQPQLCYGMIRTKIKGTGQRGRSNPDMEPDFYNMPPLVGSNDECRTSDIVSSASASLLKTDDAESINDTGKQTPDEGQSCAGPSHPAISDDDDDEEAGGENDSVAATEASTSLESSSAVVPKTAFTKDGSFLSQQLSVEGATSHPGGPPENDEVFHCSLSSSSMDEGENDDEEEDNSTLSTVHEEEEGNEHHEDVEDVEVDCSSSSASRTQQHRAVSPSACCSLPAVTSASNLFRAATPEISSVCATRNGSSDCIATVTPTAAPVQGISPVLGLMEAPSLCCTSSTKSSMAQAPMDAVRPNELSSASSVAQLASPPPPTCDELLWLEDIPLLDNGSEKKQKAIVQRIFDEDDDNVVGTGQDNEDEDPFDLMMENFVMDDDEDDEGNITKSGNNEQGEHLCNSGTKDNDGKDERVLAQVVWPLANTQEN